uniref:Protein kinase domain-containing protein n=1 Tax=Lotharella globosa TaxID=91324 RepID=A0A7S3ZGC1_9EUKA
MAFAVHVLFLKENNLISSFSETWMNADTRICRQRHENLEELMSEIAVWRTLRHPNIVMFLGATYNHDLGLMLLLEHMPGGTLKQYLEKRKGITTSENWKICLDISRALAFLHTCNPPVAHGDLKPANILFNAFGSCKIADFGLSRFVTPASPQRTPQGVFVGARYIAPELLLSLTMLLESDVYSFGMIMVDLFRRQGPISYSDLHYKTRAKKGLAENIDDIKDVRAKEIISQCILHDPTKRTNFSKISDTIEAFPKQDKCGLI